MGLDDVGVRLCALDDRGDPAATANCRQSLTNEWRASSPRSQHEQDQGDRRNCNARRRDGEEASLETTARLARPFVFRASRGRADEAGLVGGDHGLRSVAQPELAEDVADVRLHRLVAEHEAVGDLLVRQAGCDQAEDLELAASERVEVFWTGALRRPEAGELGDQAARDRRCQERVPGSDDSDRLEQRLGRTSLSRNPLAPAWSAS